MSANRSSPPSPARRTNRWAIAALVCGVGQFLVGTPAAIVAIVAGHKARGQIRRTGEGGFGMARAGLILGYVGLALTLLAIVVILLLTLSGPVLVTP
jgi:Domain of unknown function (DUF4190)